MAKVIFYPDNKSIIVENGVTILKAARKAGIVIESPLSNCL